MARSQDSPITDDIEIPTDRDELPKGDAQLVLRENGVTQIIQGPEEKVEQWLWEEVAEDLGISIEELMEADDYPMPDPDEGLAAEEFHDSGDT